MMTLRDDSGADDRRGRMTQQVVMTAELMTLRED
jgi:hypothetical protein